MNPAQLHRHRVLEHAAPKVVLIDVRNPAAPWQVVARVPRRINAPAMVAFGDAR